MTETTIQLLVGSVVLPLLGLLFRSVFKDRADKAASNFSLGVQLAYQIVNEISLRTENTIDDKAALAIKYLRDFLAADGQKLTPADESKALLIFQAMHGAELKAGK